jgi:hypothetical protein
VSVLQDKCLKALHVSIKFTAPVHIHEGALETVYKEDHRRLCVFLLVLLAFHEF